MNRTVTHKHLKRQFEIFEKTEEIEDLLMELEFSTLLMPIDIENDTLSFPLLIIEDEMYAPVFTDVYEYDKLNFPENFILTPNKFDFYLNLLNENIDGIIINVEGERFPVTKEFQQFIEPNHIFDYDPQIYTLKEIKQIRDSVNNEELEKFLEDKSNWWDYERLMDLLLKSDLFKVVLSEEDMSSEAKNGVISLHNTEMPPTALTTKVTESYTLIYTKEDEIIPKDNPMYPYLQLVNLPELMKRVLLDDLDGIILNENSQNIIIPRKFLLNLMDDFKSQNINRYDDYAFVLDKKQIDYNI